MSTPKIKFILSGQDYKYLVRCILEYRKNLINERKTANIYDDLFINLLYNTKWSCDCKGPSGSYTPLEPSR